MGILSERGATSGTTPTFVGYFWLAVALVSGRAGGRAVVADRLALVDFVEF
ncbi:MAG: hypothetical protein WC724_00440 [Candidatus Paceibacterota bacterium]